MGLCLFFWFSVVRQIERALAAATGQGHGDEQGGQ